MSSTLVRTRHDLLAQFEFAARTAYATVEFVPSSAVALAAAVGRVAHGRIAIAEPLDIAHELFAELRRMPGIVTRRSKAELASCDAGITDAFAGVARTGSVCVTVDHEYAGAISLLSRLHIAVLSAETIVERPADLFRPDRLAGKGLTRNFVFVTGPSATADMGPLVRGVHGPHKLHVILLE
ncbi:MAG TPA: LUD domain-containing protein [Terriglobales bacterium]|nr:LUD domain-containing protein [Terriglobales bacterium]